VNPQLSTLICTARPHPGAALTQVGATARGRGALQSCTPAPVDSLTRTVAAVPHARSGAPTVPSDAPTGDLTGELARRPLRLTSLGLTDLA
jgi:hypothetical protein